MKKISFLIPQGACGVVSNVSLNKKYFKIAFVSKLVKSFRSSFTVESQVDWRDFFSPTVICSIFFWCITKFPWTSILSSLPLSCFINFICRSSLYLLPSQLNKRYIRHAEINSAQQNHPLVHNVMCMNPVYIETMVYFCPNSALFQLLEMDKSFVQKDSVPANRRALVYPFRSKITDILL